jgi:DNA-binding helix-hairpin-helix protein with protein kinase domain
MLKPTTLKPTTVYDSQGRPVPLGQELGAGGEGAVHEVADGRGLAAKIYFKKIDGEHAAKIAALAAMTKTGTGGRTALLDFLAWPVDSLHSSPRGPVAGFLMPKISGFKPIHQLYGPKSRMAEFPKANWTFLLHAATNVARAFAAIHAEGNIVIGDVNHGNVLVSAQGVVKLIDCDSVQITAGGRQFLCGVGVSTHTPPELQGGSLRVLRTPNHDCFGLAVVLFQLLFVGRHPFSGRYLGPGDLPLEKAIQEFRFAYGRAAASRQMLPPPYAPDLALAPPAVALLFERAFAPEGSRAGGRPSAGEWLAALGGVKVQTCRKSPAHSFPVTLAACPWCAIEGQAGVLLFSLAGAYMPGAPGLFRLETVWAQILAVPAPGPVPALSRAAALQTGPPPKASPKALAAHASRLPKTVLAWILGVSGPLLAVAAGVEFGGCAPYLVLALLFTAASVAAGRARTLRREFKTAVRDAESRLKTLEEAWTREASGAEFQARLRELEKLRGEYLGLPALRQQKIAALQAGLAQAQLRRFLDGHRIERAKIPGIGDGRRATLQSYGIETADIAERAVMQVPGFGPALTAALLEWKRSVGARFVFNPAAGLDPRDVADLDRGLAARRSEIERALGNGIGELRQTGHQTAMRRQALASQLEAAVRALAQAETDLKAV